MNQRETSYLKLVTTTAALLICFIAVCLCQTPRSYAPEHVDPQKFSGEFQQEILPIVTRYCTECHSGDIVEGSIDLDQFSTIDDVRKNLEPWHKILVAIQSERMPPVDAPQLSSIERAKIVSWLDKYLHWEASKFANDPGPIVLRRLSNAEYTNSIRAVTGVSTLDPAREFPIDGASGEGFTNAGNGLVMSSGLLEKYLAAGKDIAAHAVLLPTGLGFSPSSSRRDWTEEILSDIRKIYAKYSVNDGATKVNLQGEIYDTNQGGRLPLDAYLRATLEEKSNLQNGTKTVEKVASERSLSPKYLHQLWTALQNPQSQTLVQLSQQWKASKVEDVPALVKMIHQWQQSLWSFASVGQIGKANVPKFWMNAVNPIQTRQEFRLKVPAADSNTGEAVLYLNASDAGDGNQGDIVAWERPRLIAPGRPDILLKDCFAIAQSLEKSNKQLLASVSQAFAAADWVRGHPQDSVNLQSLAAQFKIDEDTLVAWFSYLGLGSGTPVQIHGHLSRTVTNVEKHDFVSGWVGDDALSVIANASDMFVRIPGNLDGHAVAVHPSPTMSVAIGWQSPITGTLGISGFAQHAHPECGNGTSWEVQLRRGGTLQVLDRGISHGPNVVEFKVPNTVAVLPNDVIALLVSPRDGENSCDLTKVQLVLSETGKDDLKVWNLSQDVSSNLLASNPHADRFGNSNVWHFFSETVAKNNSPQIVQDSLVAKWQASADANERKKLAQELTRLLSSDAAGEVSEANKKLLAQLRSLGGPLMAIPLQKITSDLAKTESHTRGSLTFGELPDGSGGEPTSLYASAPACLEIRVPASLADGAEFVTSGYLADGNSVHGSVQLSVTSERNDNDVSPKVVFYDRPIIVSNEGTARAGAQLQLDDFRNLFPIALCYTKIVPADEVITSMLYYREDDALQRLMLDDSEVKELNRLWEELHFVSRDALASADALEQLLQYATQDGQPSDFDPLRQPIKDRVVAYKQQIVDSQEIQLACAIALGSKAFRRPLTNEEVTEYRHLYQALRSKDIEHEQAVQFLIAKTFASPAFLYRMEGGTGTDVSIADGEVHIRRLNDFELATRLSYFLTSSPPDQELTDLAIQGALTTKPEVLEQQARRLLNSPTTRNLATEFGCQWLQIYDFAAHDEKSETVFPTFAALRDDFYEESILFWMDFFQRDLPVTELLDSDHSFVNKELANHYGIPYADDASQPIWRRVDDIRQYGRGGVLAMASILSKQSGASRTSPILRGNWISEVLLGDKLPSPPLNVPVLPETLPAGLTERQLIEQHSSNPACAKCHEKIDPYGFALEGYDAIGRLRNQVDTTAKLYDGRNVGGMKDLRTYLAVIHKDDFVRQFCRKMLGYSLGRAVQMSDAPLEHEMYKQLSENDYRVIHAIIPILHSQQFQYVRVDHASK